jgi:hypothetical protein
VYAPPTSRFSLLLSVVIDGGELGPSLGGCGDATELCRSKQSGF